MYFRLQVLGIDKVSINTACSRKVVNFIVRLAFSAVGFTVSMSSPGQQFFLSLMSTLIFAGLGLADHPFGTGRNFLCQLWGSCS